MTAFQALTLFERYKTLYDLFYTFEPIFHNVATSMTNQRYGGKNIGGIMSLSQNVMSLARMLSPKKVSVSGTALYGSFASSVTVIIMIFRLQEPKIYTEKKYNKWYYKLICTCILTVIKLEKYIYYLFDVLCKLSILK